MKRTYAAGVLAALAALWLAVPRQNPLVGVWEAAVELAPAGQETAGVSAALRYTFAADQTYTLTVAATQAQLDDGARLQGNYRALPGKLYLSQGLDYRIDPLIYETYRLEGDRLTLEAGPADQRDFYPLTLTRAS